MISNDKGDLIKIALSCYDAEIIGMFTSDPRALSLRFYDVTLSREKGTGTVGYKVLNVVSETLGRFLSENTDVVLCFYCDDQTDVERHNRDLTPQEFRSELFSVMFDKYISVHGLTELVNHRVKIMDGEFPRITHFISRKEYLDTMIMMGELLSNTKPSV